MSHRWIFGFWFFYTAIVTTFLKQQQQQQQQLALASEALESNTADW
ncbi:MAG: hypothetical protein ACJA2Q_001237 [Pseudohongiellaceae bacterium]